MTKASTHLVPDFKIRVTDEAHSRAIQEELFKRGVKWWSGHTGAMHMNCSALYCEDSHISQTAYADDYYEEHSLLEHTFTNGKFSFDEEEVKPDADDFAEPPTLQSKKEWQKDRLMDVLKEMTRLVAQADYDTVYDLLTDEAAQLINDLKWK